MSTSSSTSSGRRPEPGIVLAASADAAPSLERRYALLLRDTLLLRLRVYCVLVVCLVPTFWILDHILMPAQVWRFLGIRMAISAVAAAVWILSRTAASRQAYLLSVVVALSVAIGIEFMIVALGPDSSPYYAGLCLVILTAGVLLPWTVQQMGLFSAAVVALYCLPVLWSRAPVSWPLFASNNFFLVTTALITTTSCHFSHRLRRREFYARIDLERQSEALARTGRELTSSLDKLKELDRVRSQFFANITHELRTPLTLALAPIESLLDDEAGPLSELQRHRLALVRRNALRLLRLVDDLLELSRIEAAELRLSPRSFDLQLLVRDLVERLEPLAQRKDITVRLHAIPDDCTISADPEEIERVLLNILANAAKFTGRSGRIDVRLAAMDDGIGIAVTDTGTGIAPEHLERIFERFFQVDGSPTRRHGGTGIGLALAREITVLHGGTVRAESELGRGTTLTVWLPRQHRIPSHAIERRVEREMVPANRRAAEKGLPEWHEALRQRDDYRYFHLEHATDRRLAPRPSVSPADGSTVLLIEDNPDMSQFVAGLLGAEFAVRVAQSGDQGLAQARAQLPDLIISDVMMPGMSGFDLVRALRGDPHTAGIPVILMTALDSVEDRMEAVDGGADAYLRKPFQPRELLGAVRALLRKHKRQVNLVQEDREQALRVLAEGVAHEVLNPIGFLQNALYILHELCTEACDLVQPPGPRLAEMRSEAERSHAAGREGIARVRDAVEALRRFSRGGGLEPGAAGDVNAVLQRVVTLVGVRGLSIQVTTELDATRRVTLRSGQLEQVLLNLLINAAHATEGRQGRVVLRSWDHPQGGVGISVSDDGPGIAAEVLEKVFYPYFTTKEPGKGTGLGLSLAREMVRQHGGSLTAASELGKGATFTIWLPEASVPAPGSSTGLAAAAPVPTAGPVPLRPPAPDAGA